MVGIVAAFVALSVAVRVDPPVRSAPAVTRRAALSAAISGAFATRATGPAHAKFVEPDPDAIITSKQKIKAELAAAGKELPPAGKASGVKARVGKGAKAKPAATVEAPKAAPEVKEWFKSRPKGGVKVLSGTDGALTGGAKRSADEAGATEEPPKKQQQLSAQ